jgi:hypothetical protein
MEKAEKKKKVTEKKKKKDQGIKCTWHYNFTFCEKCAILTK